MTAEEKRKAQKAVETLHQFVLRHADTDGALAGAPMYLGHVEARALLKQIAADRADAERMDALERMVAQSAVCGGCVELNGLGSMTGVEHWEAADDGVYVSVPHFGAGLRSAIDAAREAQTLRLAGGGGE